MSGFPLLEPPHHLVDKIIRKVVPKSNFRLRQTCRDVYDLIKTSPNIANILIGGEFTLETKGDSTLELCRRDLGTKTPVDIDGYYGARLGLLRPPDQTEDAWNLFCRFLRKYRLTCCEIQFWDKWWTVEQWAAVIKLLKPELARFTSTNSSSLNELFNCKTLVHVDVDLWDDDVSAAIDAIFPKVRSATLSARPANGDFVLLRDALMKLQSMPFQENLESFNFCFFGDSQVLSGSLKELKEEFPDLNWDYGLQLHNYSTLNGISAAVELPAHFPNGSYCKIAVRSDQAPRLTYNIHYCLGKFLSEV